MSRIWSHYACITADRQSKHGISRVLPPGPDGLELLQQPGAGTDRSCACDSRANSKPLALRNVPPKLEDIVNKALEKNQGGWWRHVRTMAPATERRSRTERAVYAQAGLGGKLFETAALDSAFAFRFSPLCASFAHWEARSWRSGVKHSGWPWAWAGTYATAFAAVRGDGETRVR